MERSQVLPLFIDNLGDLKSNFKWVDAYSRRTAAFWYALNSMRVDVAAIDGCARLIRSEEGMLSPFRLSASSFLVSCVLAMYGDPVELLGKSRAAYDAMRQRGCNAGDYLVHAALLTALRRNDADEAADDARALFDGMREYHRIITGSNDYPFIAINAASSVDCAYEIERIYESLRQELRDMDGTYILAQSMWALGQSDEVFKVFNLRSAMKRARLSAGWGGMAVTLALLALIDGDAEDIASDVSRIYAELRASREVGYLSAAGQELTAIAAAIALAEKSDVLSPVAKTGVIPADIIFAQMAGYVYTAVSQASTAGT